MPYTPETHRRRSIRLKHYDYTQTGFYFITLCVQNKESLFGEITQNDMYLNDAGKMIEAQWLALQHRFPNIQLHEYIVMPNHFHAILEVENKVVVTHQIGRPQGCAPTVSNVNKSIGDMIGAFKSITTVEYIHGIKTHQWQSFDGKLWQRNYWEHVIRHEQSLNDIAQYIINNPQNWEMDKLRPLPEIMS
jgi:putative transposase